MFRTPPMFQPNRQEILSISQKPKYNKCTATEVGKCRPSLTFVSVKMSSSCLGWGKWYPKRHCTTNGSMLQRHSVSQHCKYSPKSAALCTLGSQSGGGLSCLVSCIFHICRWWANICIYWCHETKNIMLQHRRTWSKRGCVCWGRQRCATREGTCVQSSWSLWCYTRHA